MKKTIIGIFVISLFLSCGVKKFRLSMYKNYYEETFVNYFNTELKNRPDTFLMYFQNKMNIFYSESYFFIAKSIFDTPCNIFLYSFGQKFQQDLTSLTNIQPTYEYEAGGHLPNQYTVSDKPAFFSYLDSCKQVLSGDLDFRQKPDTIPKFTTIEEPFNVKLIDYINEKPQNRIKFIKKFYKDFYPNELYLMISDIDIIYKTNIKQIFKFSGNRAYVNKKELLKALTICFPEEW